MSTASSWASQLPLQTQVLPKSYFPEASIKSGFVGEDLPDW